MTLKTHNTEYNLVEIGTAYFLMFLEEPYPDFEGKLEYPYAIPNIVKGNTYRYRSFQIDGKFYGFELLKNITPY